MIRRCRRASASPRRRTLCKRGDADLLDSLNTDNDGCTSACVPVTNSNGNLVLTGDPQSALAAGACSSSIRRRSPRMRRCLAFRPEEEPAFLSWTEKGILERESFGKHRLGERRDWS